MSAALIIELKHAIVTRGIKYEDDPKACIKNTESHAVLRLWKVKTLTKFKEYLTEMYEKIKKAKQEEKQEEKRIEDERVATVMEHKLNDLDSLNDYLIIFGKEPQASKTKARNLLKSTVFIGIYDLEAKRYEIRHNTINKLREYINANEERKFPLKIAKTHPTLKAFLQHIRRNHKS